MSLPKQCSNSTKVSLTTFCHVSSDSEFFSSRQSISIQIFAISVLIVSCILFNSLMLYAVIRTSKLRSSATSILLANLAVVNVLVGILVLPFWIISTASLGWTLPYQLCELTAFITMTLMQCSIFFLSGIAVDRYCCIHYPLRYPVVATNLRAGLVVSVIWTFCLLVASFPLYGWGRYQFQPQTIPICNPVYRKHISYTIFLILFGMALPFSLMLVSYVRIVHIARDHIRRIDDSQKLVKTAYDHLVSNSIDDSVRSGMASTPTRGTDDRASQANKRRNAKSKFKRNLKTANRVFIAVVAFFLCWGPYIILNFWFVNHDNDPIPYSADLITTLMAFANSTVNPVIFILLNKDYRQVVKQLFNRVIRCCLINDVTSVSDFSDNVGYVGDRTDTNFSKRLTNANNGNGNNNFSPSVHPCSQISIVSNSGDVTDILNGINKQSSNAVQPTWHTDIFSKTVLSGKSLEGQLHSESLNITNKQKNRTSTFHRLSNYEQFTENSDRIRGTGTSLKTEPVLVKVNTRPSADDVIDGGENENNTNKQIANFKKKKCKPVLHRMRAFRSLKEIIPGTVMEF